MGKKLESWLTALKKNYRFWNLF